MPELYRKNNHYYKIQKSGKKKRISKKEYQKLHKKKTKTKTKTKTRRKYNIQFSGAPLPPKIFSHLPEFMKKRMPKKYREDIKRIDKCLDTSYSEIIKLHSLFIRMIRYYNSKRYQNEPKYILESDPNKSVVQKESDDKKVDEFREAYIIPEIIYKILADYNEVMKEEQEIKKQEEKKVEKKETKKEEKYIVGKLNYNLEDYNCIKD